MKLVENFEYLLDAEEAARTLEEKGIATYISSRRSVLFPMSRGGASAASLWVVLEDQLSDAQQVLVNPRHRVSRKLSKTDLAEIRLSLENKDMSGVLSFLFKLLGVVALFAFIVYLAIRQ